MIQGEGIEYEKPVIGELFGEMWKGKADVVNHNDRLIIDLKTTSDINKFRSSAYRWNYDAQAYIYSTLFGYEFIFVAIDKNTLQTGIYDCSEKFLMSGRDKVIEAVHVFRQYFKDTDFDWEQFLINETL